MLHLNKTKRIELALIFLYFFIIGLVILIFRLQYFFSIIIFTTIPCLYLVWKLRSYAGKLMYESLVWSVPITILIDYTAHASSSWFETSIFNFRVLGTFPLEGFIWGFQYVLFAILFYEYFFDRYKRHSFNKRTKSMISALLVGVVALLILVSADKSIFVIRNFYGVLLGAILVFDIVGMLKLKTIKLRISMASLLLILPYLWHEFFSLALGHWYFPDGFHVGYFSYFGFIIPIEEIIWFILTIPAILIFHEIFADDEK